ncbi:MAG: restriction endonuclease subunit S [Acidobacteria bacterium]|nr:restriction endonuclease subunit S [Acidobacteriota bacterium]
MEAVREYGGIDPDSTKPLADVVDGYTYFCTGDVIVAKITPCFENGKGALATGLCNDVGFGTTELYVLRASFRVERRFLLYLTFGHHFRRIGTASMYGAGGQKRISENFIRDFRHPVPGLLEQRAIADFLDHETAKIDALVAKKERLIELLQEKRTALITRAVTRGLDPNAPMKDSGVEWLGEIPAHWDEKRVKWVARMESGHTPDKKVDAYWTDGDIPWVSLNDTRRLKAHDYISDTKYYTNELGLQNSSARLLPPRSVVFSRDATIGLCAITERAMAVSQHFIAWICGKEVTPEYLLRVFDAMQEELERLTMGATLRTIGMPEVNTLATPVPPADEQERIVGHIQRECVHLDALIAKVQEAIDHLKEFRNALIFAAVTGKIDVRAAFDEPAAALGDTR